MQDTEHRVEPGRDRHPPGAHDEAPGPLPVPRIGLHAGAQTLFVTGRVYGGLYVTSRASWQVREQIGGPIFIGQMASDSARKGLDN